MNPTKLTDTQLLELVRHPLDTKGTEDIHTVEGAIVRNNNYAWYYGLAYARRPAVIGEIGVRFGYSLYTMASGSLRARRERPYRVMGWDNQSYIGGSLQWAAKILEPIAHSVTLEVTNSQGMTELPVDDGYFEMFSVDGDHTDAGAWHDMHLAWPKLCTGGWMLIDDIDYAGADGRINLRPVVEKFAEEQGVPVLHLPTTRGLAVLCKP